ncbi:unnamed protein product [Spirodela intermedia]|uniref:Uncharacterized protein n=1 Tax=Spirodela intermedia TaxID=51605 RepID=A0A7I8J9N5_SPIIN|nr:unnamed protein product [Spirodela intermedia]CAA6666475.1 unnamed protein product [Spirodela intermedia]
MDADAAKPDGNCKGAKDAPPVRLWKGLSTERRVEIRSRDLSWRRAGGWR